ncbi:hypothetical protein L204_100181 [Cryptococcus depauperatus]|nr:hypothetical protein L204_02337 [Cryptococcus depauperatus CBS 7855]
MSRPRSTPTTRRAETRDSYRAQRDEQQPVAMDSNTTKQKTCQLPVAPTSHPPDSSPLPADVSVNDIHHRHFLPTQLTSFVGLFPSATAAGAGCVGDKKGREKEKDEKRKSLLYNLFLGEDDDRAYGGVRRKSRHGRT